MPTKSNIVSVQRCNKDIAHPSQTFYTWNLIKREMQTDELCSPTLPIAFACSVESLHLAVVWNYENSLAPWKLGRLLPRFAERTACVWLLEPAESKLLHSQRYLLLLLQMFLLSHQLLGSKGSGAFVARSRPDHPLGRGGEPSLENVLWSMLAPGEKPEDICAGWLCVLTRTAELGPQRYLCLYANKKTWSFFILGPWHST